MSVEPNERDRATKADMVEAFDMVRALIQEAKPPQGYITDHLDAAENWLDKVEEMAIHRAEIEAAITEALAAAEQRGYERGRAEVLHHEIDAARCRAVLNRLLVWHKAKSDPSLDQGHSMTSILLDAEKAIYGLDAMLAEKERRDAE